MKIEDLTIKQVVDMCYNTKYCVECELHEFCHNEFNTTPTNWEIRKYTKVCISSIRAEEVKDGTS